MPKTMMKHSLSLVVCLLTAFVAKAAPEDTTRVRTQIHLNGTLTTVYFNDGDTFKALDGEFEKSSVRIVGINTLETYGPVHQWANNDPVYLYEVSHLATEVAREGGWHCQTEAGKDTYGRLLATCNDLATALLKAGYAHAYSIDAKPAKRSYQVAQRSAQNKQLGMWQYGVPEYIITSLHSIDEGESKTAYNRLISTVDGHTEKWSHRESYGICQSVCVEDGLSCMIYVPFGQRYGSARPECLLTTTNRTPQI